MVSPVRPGRCRARRSASLSLEVLEDRTLLSGGLPGPVLAAPEPLAVQQAQVLATAVAPVAAHVVRLQAGGPANSLTWLQVTFDRPMNVSTFTPVDVRLLAPNGHAVTVTAVQVVAGTNNKTFTIQVARQTAFGTYHLQVGPLVRDTKGNFMTVYHATVTLAAPPVNPVSTFTSSTPAAIAPGGLAVSLLNVGSDIRIASLKVRVNITFPSDGDLIIHLQAPDGTDVLLAQYVGGSGQNFTNTVFDDHGGQWVLFGRAPFTGSYQPQVALSNLSSKDARGTWKLWVQNIGQSRGTVNNWSLIVTRA
jgi:subtilisin-like proprotein convertase family protein